jgi:hypothetical protein
MGLHEQALEATTEALPPPIGESSDVPVGTILRISSCSAAEPQRSANPGSCVVMLPSLHAYSWWSKMWRI